MLGSVVKRAERGASGRYRRLTQRRPAWLGASLESCLAGLELRVEGVAVAGEEVDAVVHPVALVTQHGQEPGFDVVRDDAARLPRHGRISAMILVEMPLSMSPRICIARSTRWGSSSRWSAQSRRAARRTRQDATSTADSSRPCKIGTTSAPSCVDTERGAPGN